MIGMILSRLSKPMAVALAVAALLALSTLSFNLLMLQVRSLADNAAAAARLERDAHWAGEIARANSAVLAARLAQEQSVVQLEAILSRRLEHTQKQLTETEHANADLPDTACGLDLDRVRLLRRQK